MLSTWLERCVSYNSHCATNSVNYSYRNLTDVVHVELKRSSVLGRIRINRNLTTGNYVLNTCRRALQINVIKE